LNILGSTMGNHTEFAEMLGFVTTHRIRPVIDSVFQMQEYKAAFDRMATGQQFGKIVISLT
ncbi:MAG TPA: zinc-binding dehydrogenase, partial [Saprospiraceae bacterium]|nr:zinc-binding dehydrogenase [Saprospiraceae bacterium]